MTPLPMPVMSKCPNGKSRVNTLWRFLLEEKKWWLAPLVVFVVILAALVYFTQGREPLSPFMYTVK
jgi:hypothetical protein